MTEVSFLGGNDKSIIGNSADISMSEKYPSAS